jgi:DNA-binding NarL/FixJ family response regulator
MQAIDNPAGQAGAPAGDQTTVTVRCGIPALESALAEMVQAMGVPADWPAVLLLVDLPCGFALRTLATAPPDRPCIVITGNPCPDYGDDLWDCGPAGLIANLAFDHVLLDALTRVSQGEGYRLSANGASRLTATERAMLRGLARAWDNRRIARQLHLEEKTVRNALTRVYVKIGVANRVEAALYYWGRADLFR